MSALWAAALDNALGLVLAVGVAAYLVAVLVRSEKF